MKKSSRRDGFTLVEIILVVLILAVIASLTLPNFSRSYAQVRLRQSAQGLVDLMRYAQSRAVAHNRRVRLEFDDALSKYWLTEEAGVRTQTSPEDFHRFPGRFGRDFVLPGAVGVQTDTRPLTFFPDGSIEKGQINICLDQRCLTISTQWQRGYVRLINPQKQ